MGDGESAQKPSVAKTLFIGKILEEGLFPFPTIKEAEKETLQMVLESIDRFMQGREEDYRRYDAKGEQPPDYIDSLRELGLFGLIIGEEYGGIGFSNTAYSRSLQQVTRYDGSTSLTIGAHSSIGMKGLLLFGNAEQKKRYLPRLASGELIAAFCLTEPGSGSDAASIKTQATKNKDGGWTLNGEKLWISNGGIAGFFTVFARTDSEEGKISAFIVERGWPGVSVGNKEDKMGIRASSTTSVIFNNVQVPSECLLGEEGKGFKIAMSILNNGRTGLGGGCVGAMKSCIALAVKQSTERKQFGKSISEFALVQEKIAQMTINCFAAESVVAVVGHLIDSKVEDFSVEAAISKIFSTEALWSSACEALQIAGGNGFMKDFPYERIVRDSRINMIFEGTNEILRLYVALSGLKDAGDYYKDITKSLGNVFNDPIKGFGVLTGYAAQKLAQYTSLGHTKIDQIVEPLRESALIYERYTAQFAKVVETVLRQYGKEIIGRQLITKRIADIAIDLFVGLCVLARVNKMIQERGVESCRSEISIASVFSMQAKRRINQNIRRIDKNEDTQLIELAKATLQNEGYTWDII